jgi:hypothetical protein
VQKSSNCAETGRIGKAMPMMHMVPMQFGARIVTGGLCGTALGASGPQGCVEPQATSGAFLFREGNEHHFRVEHGISHIVDIKTDHATLTASLLVQSNTFEPISEAERIW